MVFLRPAGRPAREVDRCVQEHRQGDTCGEGTAPVAGCAGEGEGCRCGCGMNLTYAYFFEFLRDFLPLMLLGIKRVFLDCEMDLASSRGIWEGEGVKGRGRV